MHYQTVRLSKTSCLNRLRIFQLLDHVQSLRSNFNTREFNCREHDRFLGHNSESCGNFRTVLRHKLPIIHPDLSIPTSDLSSSVKPEFLNPKSLSKNPKHSVIIILIPLKGPIRGPPFLGTFPPGWAGHHHPLDAQ